MPRLTVILSSFNRPDGLRDAIASVLSQTFTDLQLVICDDCSNDVRVHNILEASQNDSRVRVLHGPTRDAAAKAKICSMSALINCALLTTKSEFVSYLGDGTTYFPNRCERLIKFLDEHSDVHIVWDHQNTVRFDHNGAIVERRLTVDEPDKLQYFQGPSLVTRLAKGNFIDHSSAIERRNFFFAWSEHPADWQFPDWRRWQQAAVNNLKFAFFPGVGEEKRITPINIGAMIGGGRSIIDVVKARGGI